MAEKMIRIADHGSFLRPKNDPRIIFLQIMPTPAYSLVNTKTLVPSRSRWTLEIVERGQLFGEFAGGCGWSPVYHGSDCRSLPPSQFFLVFVAVVGKYV